ncbi:copper chaperone PCu(A)C [Parasphingorhabdus halotolerans]|uniref:Copper chaperone PCu(A)C n=1 Tax=Parasphingorhabdus halotolerans TaxID=2725558 RepID=A0A6H2DLX6_9SPHN|nr:copper chaperone PCu(A)C [Parasphingorhabdus halotolerans]QJB68955.1 copper chaperone PCu(A)C [Parasphingorhabdus halotolerans]
MMKPLSIFSALTASVFLASCGQGDVLFADNAVINLSPVEGNPASGYMDLHGGRLDVELVGVTSDDVLRMEMHETVEENGMATMKPIKSVKIPRGKTVKFEPGGKHLMVWGVGGGSVKRGLLDMTLIYSNDDRIKIQAVVKKPGTPDEDSKKDAG